MLPSSKFIYIFYIATKWRVAAIGQRSIAKT
jgi:hypothetical protein